MITAIHGIKKEPFNRTNLSLLRQQKEIIDIIKIHSQQGGFSVILGEPGVCKSVLREHIEAFKKSVILRLHPAQEPCILICKYSGN